MRHDAYEADYSHSPEQLYSIRHSRISPSLTTISMDQGTHRKIVSWGIADDVRHDLFKRGKHCGRLQRCRSAACSRSLVPMSNRLHLSRTAPHARTAAAASENPA
jgi:hypothetical protein